jgi:hypothetical protein
MEPLLISTVRGLEEAARYLRRYVNVEPSGGARSRIVPKEER